MRTNAVKIGSKWIGPGCSCFVIAEAGVNHNGDLETAKKLVDAAVFAGADAVKFQTFKAESLVTEEAPKASYQKRDVEAESQFNMLQRLELFQEELRELADYCRKNGMMFLSSPFDEESVDLLEELNVSSFKIGSGEITNWPLLEYVASKKKPIFLSTGMSYLSEVDEAVRLIQSAGCDELVLLHCVSVYPARPSDVNLRAMNTLREAFGRPVGFSDHTLGVDVALAAVALGASVIEKHLTLDKNMHGPDHKASLEPEEMKNLIQGVRKVEAALGHGRKEPVEAEREIMAVARKSLVTKVDIPAGARLMSEMIAIKRPGTGLYPAFLNCVVGRKAKSLIPAGTIIEMEMLE